MEETTPVSTNAINTRKTDDSLIIDIKRNDHDFSFTMPIKSTCTWGMVLDAAFDAFSAVQQLSHRAIQEAASKINSETVDAELKE
jgi:hypothetical protein